MKISWIVRGSACIVLVLLTTACQNIQQFKDKVVTETQKTAHYTVEPDQTPVTMEQLIDKGQTDHFIFNDQVYQMDSEVTDKQVGKVIGAVGQLYYVDQYGKRWTAEELKNTKIYQNPQEIREKKPLHYDMVFRPKSENDKEDFVIIRFNHKYFKAVPVKKTNTLLKDG
ncbi:NisI/SpaI family lantibiotic immunity lipoprotein [Paenibacillus sp. Z6-24]